MAEAPRGRASVVEREFDALAPEYERNRLAPWYQAQADEVLRACPEPGAGDILDVGCGTGYLLRRMLRTRPAARGLGIDLAGEMVRQASRLAAENHIDNVRFIRADWESLDPCVLEEYDFRLAFCTSAFHYFSNPGAATVKLYRALGPGGSLYLVERNKSRSLMTGIWGWLHRHWIRDNVSFYELEELQSLLRAAGFARVRTLRTINRVLWKNKLYTSVALIECTR